MILAIGNVGDALEHHAGFAGADRLQALRAGGAALRGNVEAAVAPVRRHLAAAGIRIVFRAHRRQQHFL